jgi:23S rRNA (adenine2030-N6)-methyltransferase
VLLALLDALRAKPKPMCYLETHAGAGNYALEDERARKTGESHDGIERLLAMPKVPATLQRYVDVVRAGNVEGSPRTYPGSPLLAAHALRAEDRLVLCELQPEEADALRSVFRNDERAHVHQRDGYTALKALLPPAERRGLVLIDPPFEQQSQEFRVIETALAQALERWPTGVYAVWYPIKQRATIRPFERWLGARSLKSALLVELLVRADDSPLRLNGCGMAIVNAPWRFEATLAAMLPALESVLRQGDGASRRLQSLA